MSFAADAPEHLPDARVRVTLKRLHAGPRLDGLRRRKQVVIQDIK